MTRPRVVIVGGGFGGVSAARALRKAPVDITLLDRTNHYLFQPLLYQVATGLLSPSDIAVPTRALLRHQRNVEVLLADVAGIDLGRRVVGTEEGHAIAYDYLVVASGSRHSYFGHPEWERLAPGLKTLDDAHRIMERFVLAFEDAEKAADPAERQALLTFVVVGGGPTGVELAGILPSITRKAMRQEFRRIDPAESRILLLEAGPRILPTFPESLSARATQDLRHLGVDVRVDALVTAISPDEVIVGNERIAARTVFWAAGNAASPLVRRMGVDVDRAGRALVTPDLSLPDHPEVFVVGDAAAVPLHRRRDGHTEYVPGVAPAANQMGAHAGEMIARALERRPALPFRYRDKGALAIIGRNRAIADFGWLRLTGRLAFFTWLFAHLLFLVGFRNRLSVALEWGYAYVTYRMGARLVTDPKRERPAPEGESRAGSR